jgi:hypothetical protein
MDSASISEVMRVSRTPAFSSVALHVAEHPNAKLFVESLTETTRVTHAGPSEQCRDDHCPHVDDGDGDDHGSVVGADAVVDGDLGEDRTELEGNRLDQDEGDCAEKSPAVRSEEAQERERFAVPDVEPPADVRDDVLRFVLEDLLDLRAQLTGNIGRREAGCGVGCHRARSAGDAAGATSHREHQASPCSASASTVSARIAA